MSCTELVSSDRQRYSCAGDIQQTSLWCSHLRLRTNAAAHRSSLVSLANKSEVVLPFTANVHT